MKTTFQCLRMTCGALILSCLLYGAAWAQATDWDKAGAEVQARGETMQTQAKETVGIVSRERTVLTEQVQVRRDAVQRAQAQYEALMVEFEVLRGEEEALNLELAEEQEAIKALEGAIRQAAKEADEMISENPLTAAVPERRQPVETLLDDHAFAGLPAISALVDVFFQEMELSGQVLRRQGAFMGRDGLERQGDILHVGPFTTYYQAGEDLGFLTPNADGTRLNAVGGEAPSAVRGAIAAFMTGSSEALPVDVSNGAVFRRMTAEKTWQEWFQAGGLLAWPILLVGAAGLLLGLERFFTLGRTRAFSAKRLEEITDYVRRGQFEAGREYCAKNKSYPACRVLGRALDHVGESQEVLENSLQEAILRELPRLERFLPTMQVLAAIAPLLGLLGTVTGMINTFQVITLFGTGDPRMMSGGISEALVTTQLGLAVAIPIMVLHHFLERRVDTIVGDMEQKGTAFSVSLLKAGAVKTDASEAPAPAGG